MVVSDVQFADAAELSSSSSCTANQPAATITASARPMIAKRLLDPDAADVSSDSGVLVTWAPNMKGLSKLIGGLVHADDKCFFVSRKVECAK